ncbi:sugar 3,4-ketoisomerase [Haloflavibacter putidus]|uniref:WxcM-like domain-containing protein n=1 Tax=Haloflavibacter putidus TaxID=2576776 RepID=A0A507ZRB3_9FLAO|nr:FdtA/QdtA family cupin domain-containing protein [Haloflavibacter putidus]TQD38814.1 WxcM-like domain-containing protein [Haloflavibacter putidus]
MKNTIKDSFLINLPKISDPDGKGNLSVIEKDILPYPIKRVYYLYDVPSDSTRGGHAHIELNQCLIALSGSFEVILDDGKNTKRIQLNKPNKGLIIPNGIWREIENFSSGSVCLALVSAEYDEEDYIRDYKDFRVFKTSS